MTEWFQKTRFPESDLLAHQQVNEILSNRVVANLSAKKIMRMATGIRELSKTPSTDSLVESILLWEEGSKLMDASRIANDPKKLATKHEKKFLQCLTPPGICNAPRAGQIRFKTSNITLFISII